MEQYKLGSGVKKSVFTSNDWKIVELRPTDEKTMYVKAYHTKTLNSVEFTISISYLNKVLKENYNSHITDN